MHISRCYYYCGSNAAAMMTRGHILLTTLLVAFVFALATEFVDAVSQYDILTSFYRSTGGPQWTNRDGWTDATRSTCSWYGIHCNAQNEITQIVLRSNNLQGQLSPMLGLLAQLSVLDLRVNAIAGQIPVEYSAWTSISTVMLDSNLLTGSMNSNPLSHVLQSWCVNGSLSTLSLRYNAFSGQLPTDFGLWCQSLMYFSIAANDIDGPIPESLGSIPFLVQFEAFSNRLMGPIPSALTNAMYLMLLQLGQNQLTCLPPDDEIAQWQSMIVFDVSWNEISGAFPAGVLALPDLSFLNLAGNLLSGAVPDALFRSPSLKKVFLSENLFSGPLPTLEPGGHSLVNISLRTLALDHNMFNGSLATHIFDLPELSFLDVSNNAFEGEFDFVRVGQAFQGSNLAFVSFVGNPQMRHSEFVAVDNYAAKKSSPAFDLQTLTSVDAESTHGVVLPPQLEFTPRNPVLYPAGRYSCENVVLKLLPNFQILVSDAYFSFANCQCQPFTYGLPPDNCGECPSGGADCSQGGRRLYWTRGLYPALTDSGVVAAIMPCLDTQLSVDHSLCCPSNNCSALYGDIVPSGSPSWCGDGASERLCSKCECSSRDQCGVFEGGACIKCRSPLMISVYVMMATAAVSAIILFLRMVSKALAADDNNREFSTSAKRGPSDSKDMQFHEGLPLLPVRSSSYIASSSSGYATLSIAALQTESRARKYLLESLARERRRLSDMFQILISHMQILAVLCSSSSIHDGVVHTVGRSLSWTLFVPTSTVGLACVFPSLSDPVSGFTLLVVFPAVLLFVLATVSLFVQRWVSAIPASSGVKRWWLLFAKSAVFILTLMYFGITKATLEMFHCEEEVGTKISYLHSIPWLRCSFDSYEYRALRSLAITSAVAYVTLIPTIWTLALLWVWFRQYRDHPGVVFCMSSLFESFTPSAHFYGVFLMLRRLLLAVFLAVVSGDHPVQQFGVLMVLLCALLVQVKSRPWASDMCNRCEEASLVALVILQGALMQQARSSSLSSTHTSGGNVDAGLETLLILSVVTAGMVLLYILGVMARSVLKAVHIVKHL